MPGSGEGFAMVPVRIIFWALFLIISAVTIYIFSFPNERRGTLFALQNYRLGEAHTLNPHCSGYARKCYRFCFAHTGVKCHELPIYLYCIPTSIYISVQMDRQNLWWEQTGARGGGSQQLTADILSVQATLWSSFTHCVSVD